MNKKVFTALIVLMGISILGIISVQLIWMTSALKVKNELFDRGVSDALSNTVNSLEKINDLDVVNEMVFSNDLIWVDNEDQKAPPAPILKYRGNTSKQPVKIIRQYSKPKNTNKFEIKIDNNGNSTELYEYRFSADKKNTEHIIVNSQKSIKNQPGKNTVETSADADVMFIYSDSLVGDIDSLYTLSFVHIDSFVSEIDTLHELVPGISKRVRIKADKLKSTANQLVTEISTWDVREIDHQLIADVLKNELNNRNIPIKFDFAVIQDSLISFISQNGDSILLASSKYKANLYPHDIFQKNIQLALFFPGQNSFIYRSVNWLLLASFIFSMIILITFATSIFYILKQKKISEMKSDFINNMTHEFKTPIATISVAADSIVNNKVITDPEQVRYFTSMIKKENIRMNRQVEDILTIASLDKKDFEFKWEALNAHDIVNSAIQSIYLQVKKRGGTIITKLDAGNAVITSDKIHCTNILYNLLDNANKYSDKAPEIKVSSKNDSKGIIISIEDNGIGMNKAVQNKIFERFYRQSSGNIHNVKGFGLGLSYVKAVVTANKGSISVTSEQGKGAKFDVFLPFVRE